MIIRNLATYLYNTVVDLNIFPVRDFGSHVNRTTAKRLGQWSTRLFIILFIIGLSVLALYNIVKPQVQTKNFHKPSLNVYNHLKDDYEDKLECSCSSIASPYKKFVKIEPMFHQVRKY
jgi:hypothetical protein